MNLKLVRTNYTQRSTVGELYVEDSPQCFTLELPRGDGTHGYCIYPGAYAVLIDFSERFQRAMPRLVNVPNREGILIHWGNVPADTEGCILVGNQHELINPDFIGDSRAAFNALFIKLASAKGITITIQENNV